MRDFEKTVEENNHLGVLSVVPSMDWEPPTRDSVSANEYLESVLKDVRDSEALDNESTH